MTCRIPRTIQPKRAATTILYDSPFHSFLCQSLSPIAIPSSMMSCLTVRPILQVSGPSLRLVPLPDLIAGQGLPCRLVAERPGCGDLLPGVSASTAPLDIHHRIDRDRRALRGPPALHHDKLHRLGLEPEHVGSHKPVSDPHETCFSVSDFSSLGYTRKRRCRCTPRFAA